MTGPAPGLREPLTTFFAATAVSSALYWTAPHLPFLSANLHGFIAIIFLYAPSLAARASGRPFDYQASGLHAAPIGFNLALAGLAALLTWPLFVGLVLGGYGLLCRAGLPPMLRDVVVPFCARWTGLSGMRLRFPDNFFLLAITQLVVIAIPEELFFRGYLMSRLEQRWPSRRRFWGAAVGWPLVGSSVLFAVGHVLVDFDPSRLAVFFPALVFGWMRARSGSLAPGALFHASCNLLSDVLYASFFS